MTEPMKQGALARVVAATDDLTPSRPGVSPRRYQPGFEFEVEDYVPDGEINGEPVEFYWGNADGGVNNVAVRAEDVEQAKSAEEMAARRLPAVSELLEEIGNALLSRDGVYAIEPDKKNRTVTVYGRAENGLSYGFDVKLEGCWRTDD